MSEKEYYREQIIEMVKVIQNEEWLCFVYHMAKRLIK